MEQKTIRAAAALVAALSLCACPRARLGRPAWLVTEQDADFPRERYWLAAAGAEDPDRAQVLARQLLQQKAGRALEALARECADALGTVLEKGEKIS